MATMRSVGIDLAVQPSNTGVASIAWQPDGSGVASLSDTGDDDALVELLLDRDVDVVGLDVPLGWPVAFVDAVVTRRAGRQIVVDSWADFYARTRSRATDRWLRSSSAQANPISVSMDKIGATAMRAAWLLSRAEGEGLEIDRTGLTGRVVEVYPAAALKQWRLLHSGYKGSDLATLRNLSGEFLRRSRITVDAEISNDHELDALISAVVARLARTGGTQLIPRDLLELARSEGWIHIPTGPLSEARSDSERRA